MRLLPCCIAMTWVPAIGRRIPYAPTDRPAVHHAAGTYTICRLMFWRGARRPCHFPCLWHSTQHQVSMCESGADALTWSAMPRALPHRLTRSQNPRPEETRNETRISAEIRVLRSAALPSTVVSRELASNTPSCYGHQHGQLPCITLHTDDRAMQIPFLWPEPN